MLRLNLHLIGFLGCVFALLSAASATATAADRPNVLIIMTDDQGYGDFSAHGNPVLKTPHLDKFREQCVRFTDFHVAPMCTPTRGQLMTGVDAVRNGATSVTAGRAFARPGIPMMPEIFRNAGYRTGLFGKWHLGDNAPHRPNDRGFDEAVYHLGWGFTSAPEFANTLFDGRCFHNGKPEHFEGHCTTFWFSEAMKWMRECKQRKEPFLCYLPTNAPHAPHVVSHVLSDPYEGRGPAKFFGMITHIDQNMCRLLAFLHETKLDDNTIVIFMTDNGGTAGVKLFNAGMRGGKTTYYEGGHRVPCWIRWPAGNLGQPRDISVPTQNQDILPTVLELAGIAPPANARFDGRSLAGLLTGNAEKLDDRMLVVQYGQQIEKFKSCVIWNNWRLVHGKELYDIQADPGQEQDVASKHPEIVSKLREHYEQWWKGVEPKVNDFVTTSLGSEEQPDVQLTSSDWENIYADNAGHVRNGAGGPRGGHWNVFVERPGEYRITLRRWPAEVKTALSAAYDADSKAFPIAAAKLEVAGQSLTTATKPKDTAAVFAAKLPAGPAKLQGWFQDEKGQDLCGAFYADVELAKDDNEADAREAAPPAGSPSAKVVKFHGYERAVELKRGNAHVVLCPQVGGRVLQFSIDGKEAMYLDDQDKNWQPGQPPPVSAGRFDYGPELVVEAHPKIWSGEWTAEIESPFRANLTSPRDGGMRLTRDFKLVGKGPRQEDPPFSLVCTQTMRNVSDDVREVCHWGRSFSPGGGICLIPLGAQPSRFPSKYAMYEDSAIINVRNTDEKIRERDGFLEILSPPRKPKLGFDSYAGWLAYAMPNDTLFVKRFQTFPNRVYNEAAGLTLSVWYPTGPRIELEPIGPRERLKPGEEAGFTEEWHLLPYKFPKAGEQLNLPALRKFVSEQLKLDL
jgi:arylsulfatase